MLVFWCCSWIMIFILSFFFFTATSQTRKRMSNLLFHSVLLYWISPHHIWHILRFSEMWNVKSFLEYICLNMRCGWNQMFSLLKKLFWRIHSMPPVLINWVVLVFLFFFVFSISMIPVNCFLFIVVFVTFFTFSILSFILFYYLFYLISWYLYIFFPTLFFVIFHLFAFLLIFYLFIFLYSSNILHSMKILIEQAIRMELIETIGKTDT